MVEQEILLASAGLTSRIFRIKQLSVEFMVVGAPLTPPFGRKTVEHMQLIIVNSDNLAHIHATLEFTEPTVLTVFGGGLCTLPGIVHLHVYDTSSDVL